MARGKINKHFYIPGIISLTILPFLFYFFGNNLKKAINQGVIQVFFYDPELPKKYPDMFDGQYPPKRNYIEISLTGNNYEDAVKLNFSQVRLREILSRNDSVNGIHYQFGNSAQYWSFVKALDICQMEKAKTYMPYENNIWVYHIPPDTTIQTFVCGITYRDITPKPSWWVVTSEKLQWIGRTSWLLLAGFLILVVFSLHAVQSRLNNGR
jgi:hypothetical protein